MATWEVDIWPSLPYEAQVKIILREYASWLANLGAEQKDLAQSEADGLAHQLDLSDPNDLELWELRVESRHSMGRSFLKLGRMFRNLNPEAADEAEHGRFGRVVAELDVFGQTLLGMQPDNFEMAGFARRMLRDHLGLALLALEDAA